MHGRLMHVILTYSIEDLKNGPRILRDINKYFAGIGSEDRFLDCAQLPFPNKRPTMGILVGTFVELDLKEFRQYMQHVEFNDPLSVRMFAKEEHEDQMGARHIQVKRASASST